MGKPVILHEETYEKLAGLKRAMGHTMSFETIIKELIRISAGSISTEDRFKNEVTAHFQKIEIWRFIRYLQDHELMSHNINEVDMVVPLLYLINGKWIELAAVVQEKARFVKQSLDQYADNLEVIERHQKEKFKSENGQDLENIIVPDAKKSTSPGNLNSNTTKSTKAKGRKGKRK